MNRYIILITGLFILFGSRLTGQPDTALSIEQCRQWAVEHHPLYQQYGLLDQSNDLKIKNLKRRTRKGTRMQKSRAPNRSGYSWVS